MIIHIMYVRVDGEWRWLLRWYSGGWDDHESSRTDELFIIVLRSWIKTSCRNEALPEGKPEGKNWLLSWSSQPPMYVLIYAYTIYNITIFSIKIYDIF